MDNEVRDLLRTIVSVLNQHTEILNQHGELLSRSSAERDEIRLTLQQNRAYQEEQFALIAGRLAEIESKLNGSP